MGTNTQTLTHSGYAGVQRRSDAPPRHSPDGRFGFIRGGTLTGGLGQQGNKCCSHTRQDLFLLQRWMGRTRGRLWQRHAWIATQLQQIYIFMNNKHIVSVDASEPPPTTASCAKRKHSALMQTDACKAAEDQLFTIYSRSKKWKREENHTEALSCSRQPAMEILSSDLQRCLMKPYPVNQRSASCCPAARPWTPRPRMRILSRRFETELDNRGPAGANCQIG